MKIDIPYEGTIEFVYDGLIESVRHVDNFSKLEPQIKEQVVYKLRHKHTGLFFDTPDYLLGNLSKTGKVFNTIPPRKGKVTLTKDVAESLGYECVNSTITKSCKLDDWEVISYTLTEIKE